MIPNSIFAHLVWVLGKNPKMEYDGKISELDCVAQTCLETPAFGSNVSHVSGTIKIKDREHDVQYETGFGFTCADFVTCWDFISIVNDYAEDLDVYGNFQVEQLEIIDDKIIITCS